ncbi:uncharacterized protein LOC127739092 [Mytilus californianus]|uniref:uncharacterized protein LOC127739092 n=1 Tax=Mytilus californianus TaxID=6549 RepID=UPI00224848BF|nr:uncharacterized protein LOC127739092 [Mytilus californianus]
MDYSQLFHILVWTVVHVLQFNSAEYCYFDYDKSANHCYLDHGTSGKNSYIYVDHDTALKHCYIDRDTHVLVYCYFDHDDHKDDDGLSEGAIHGMIITCAILAVVAISIFCVRACMTHSGSQGDTTEDSCYGQQQSTSHKLLWHLAISTKTSCVPTT